MPLWITIVEWINRFVLLGLVGLSVWSVTVILNRRRFFREMVAANLSEGNWVDLSSKTNQAGDLKKRSEQALSVQGRLAALVLTDTGASAAQLDRKTQAFLQEQRIQFEQGLSTLATLGSNAPLLGCSVRFSGSFRPLGCSRFRRTREHKSWVLWQKLWLRRQWACSLRSLQLSHLTEKRRAYIEF